MFRTLITLSCVILPLASILGGCQTTQTKHVFEPNSAQKVPVSPSRYISRVLDERPVEEKFTRTIVVGGEEIQFLGDDVFEISPLHDLASSLSTWLERNPGKDIEIHSLIVHYGGELESEIAMSYKPAPFYYSYDPMVIILSDLLSSQWQQTVGGITVVVKLYVKIDGQSYLMEHIQSPVSHTTPIELISNAIDYTGYKLSQKLLSQ